MSKSSFTYHVSPLHCPLTCYLSERLTVHLPIHGMSNSPLTCTTPTLNIDHLLSHFLPQFGQNKEQILAGSESG